MRKRTIRQGQISQRRRSKRPFLEHTRETKRRKEERRASGEATLREDSSPSLPSSTPGSQGKTVPFLVATSRRVLSVPFLFSPGCLLLVLCLGLSWSVPVTPCVSHGGRLCICQLQCLVSCSRHFVDTSGQTTEVHLVFAFCLPWPPAMWKASLCRRMSCDLRMSPNLGLDSK